MYTVSSTCILLFKCLVYQIKTILKNFFALGNRIGIRTLRKRKKSVSLPNTPKTTQSSTQRLCKTEVANKKRPAAVNAGIRLGNYWLHCVFLTTVSSNISNSLTQTWKGLLYCNVLLNTQICLYSKPEISKSPV